jgi:hypothetical protein
MTKVIQQFMWTYQNVLRDLVAVHADLLFKEIGWEVKSQAFLVGVRAPDRPGPNRVCLEPEDGKWSFAKFADLDAAVAASIPKHDLQNLIFDDKTAMREKPENIRCTVVSEEVQRIVANLDTLDDTASFVSQARRVDDYHVVAVLQIPKADLTDLPGLSPARHQGFPLTTHFAHSCIRQILGQAWDLLGTREPGRTRINQSLYPREHARRAASDFLNTVTIMTAGRWQGMDLFTALNDVSTVMYERQESFGRLLLVDPASEEIEYVLKLATPVPLREVRWSRKLIQLSCGDTKLICNGELIFGVGRWTSDQKPVFEVDFFAQRSWTLRRGTQEFLRSNFGDPKIPKAIISQERFLENYGMLFPQASQTASRALWQALRDLEGINHGSLLVVSEDAASEALRLKDQGTVIESTLLTASLLESASRIDGAILVDPEGWCHAIGVIVDGSANSLGSPSRGGRYNAALRYVLVSSPSRMAIVLSDDYTLDVIPLLLKRVSRRAVERMIDQLEVATLDTYHEPRSFLEAHRFYLDVEQCGRVNTAVARIHSEPRKWNTLVINTDPFKPHPGMEPIYWLDE